MSNWIWLDESISGTCGLMAKWLLPKCDILYPLLMVIVVIVEILLSQSLICTQFNWNFFASEKPCLPHTNEYYNCILILSYMVCILTEHTRTRVHCRICLTNWWALEIITYCDDISRIAVVSWFYRHCLFQNKYVPVYPLDCDMNSIFSRHDKQGKWMCRKKTHIHTHAQAYNKPFWQQIWRAATFSILFNSSISSSIIPHSFYYPHTIFFHSFTHSLILFAVCFWGWCRWSQSGNSMSLAFISNKCIYAPWINITQTQHSHSTEMYEPNFGKISKKNWIFFPFTFIVHRKLFLLIWFFSVLFSPLSSSLLRACVRAHTSAHAVSVSVAFSISLPAFSLCVSTANEQHTSTSVMLAKKNGNIHFHHMFFCALFFSAMHASLSHCIVFFFSFASYPILRIKPSSSPLPLPLPPLPIPPASLPSHCCCHCPIAPVANIIVK